MSSVAALLLAAVVARTADVKTVPVAGLSLIIDGDPIAARPPDHPRQVVYDLVLDRLRPHGFVILPAGEEARWIGASLLARAEIGVLAIDLRPPAFSFRAGYRAKAGSLEIRNPRSGKRLWTKDLDVRSDLPFGELRRQKAVAALDAVLGQLWAGGGLRARTEPFLTLVLQMNDLGRDAESFAIAARRLAALPQATDTGPLLDVALDRRAAADPGLRADLLRQVVVSRGPAATAALGRALARAFAGEPEDTALVTLLAESIEQVGAAPGDTLLPALAGLPLARLLAARSRFAFRGGAAGLDLRIAEIAGRDLAAAAGFDAAAEIAGSLPLAALPFETRRRLRDALYSRIEAAETETALDRLRRLFPPEQYPPEEEDQLDRQYLDRASALRATSESARLAHYHDYLRTAPRARAAHRLAEALGIAGALEAELTRRIATAPPGADPQPAITEVFGPNPGPEALESLGRALVEALGPDPADPVLLAVVERHPGIASLAREAKRRGLARDRDLHVFPVQVGDRLEACVGALGKPGKQEAGLSRGDLSPTAAVSARGRVEAAAGRGFAALSYPKLARILLRDGAAFRVLIEDSRGKFHHGVRTGDGRAEAIAALGEPAASRSLLFGREVLTWRGLHGGGADLHLVLDRGRVSFLYEERPDAAQALLAAQK